MSREEWLVSVRYSNRDVLICNYHTLSDWDMPIMTYASIN